MKADVDQLKNQMSQMFKMMMALKDAIVVRNEEARSSQQGAIQTRNPNHGNRANQEFPPYGLPLNYELPYEECEGQETIPPIANAASTRVQPEYTQVPPAWEGFQRQYRPNYRPSSPYVANTIPSYQYNAPRPQSGYRPPPITHNAYHRPNAGGQNFNQAQNQNLGQRSNAGEKTVKFTPIPMTYTELLPYLLKNALVALCLAKTLQPPYPRYYDASAKCGYHSGEVGHSTENCRALKFKVQSLIDSGWLTFQE